MLKKQNRSSGRSAKVAKAILGVTIDEFKISTTVIKPATDKSADSKLGIIDNDPLFSYGPVTHYFHNVTSSGLGRRPSFQR